MARTGLRKIAAPYGEVALSPPEELIVGRILVSRYPQEYEPARDCAKKLVAAGLNNEVEIDWNEVKRIAKHSAYANWSDVEQLINEEAKALQVRSPYHSDE